MIKAKETSMNGIDTVIETKTFLPEDEIKIKKLSPKITLPKLKVKSPKKLPKLETTNKKKIIKKLDFKD